ncbi:RICIN domain-containing protein [Streptomyces sp. NBC_00557]|uniref:RICIN domain-containing protein n=1 Tax=Streptomyces sp. NBC_00557 TaxID=2975776 RepID=UPI002E81E26C|nr:ricin-type beta-trefoil lectin domain protein [Streptomyces sp. NBC_00557]WUC33276.1 ricin-type beta-trefoil lectin domain protein [Streptomyces sp. NBC_00557]
MNEAGPSDEQLSAELKKLTRGAPALQPIGELLDRHWEAAFAYARLCTDGTRAAGMLTTAAFTRLFGASLRQSGPTAAWRPQILVAVRRIAAEWESDGRQELLHPALRSGAGGGRAAAMLLPPPGRRLLSRAFQRVPQASRTVLWHTEVEGEPIAVPAALLGLDPEDAGIELRRARERLREECLQAHRELAPDDECRRYQRMLDVTFRRGGAHIDPDLREHLGRCGHCGRTADQLAVFTSGLGLALAEAVLGWGAQAYVDARTHRTGEPAHTAPGAGTVAPPPGEAFTEPPYPGGSAGARHRGAAPTAGDAERARGRRDAGPTRRRRSAEPAPVTGSGSPRAGDSPVPTAEGAPAAPGRRGGSAGPARLAGSGEFGRQGDAEELSGGGVSGGPGRWGAAAGFMRRGDSTGTPRRGSSAAPTRRAAAAAVPGRTGTAEAAGRRGGGGAAAGDAVPSGRSALRAARARRARRRNVALAVVTVSGLVALPLVLWSVLGSGDGAGPAGGGAASPAPGKGAGSPSWAGSKPAGQGVLHGRLRNLGSGLCVGIVGKKAVKGAETELAACSAAPGQQWTYDTDGLLRSSAAPELCLDSRLGYSVRLAPCSATGDAARNIRYDFTLQGALIPRWNQNLALTPAATDGSGALVVKDRAPGAAQRWSVDTAKTDLQMQNVDWAGDSSPSPAGTSHRATPAPRASRTTAPPDPKPSATGSGPSATPTATSDPCSAYPYFCGGSGGGYGDGGGYGGYGDGGGYGGGRHRR